MKIRAINQILHKGEVLPPGTEFEIEDEFVESLLDINAVELINEAKSEIDIENMSIEELITMDIGNLKQPELVAISEKYNIALKGARSNKDKARIIVKNLEELLNQENQKDNGDDNDNPGDADPDDVGLNKELDDEEPMTGMPED